MDEKSKLPSWLQDRKKMVIITLVLLSMIVSAFNNITISRAVVSRVVDTSSIAERIEGSIKSAVSNNGLEGTYQNIYVEETMMFTKDGTVIYTYSDQMLFGTYEIQENYLILNLDGYEYVFDILLNDGSVLNLAFNGYEYNYQKLY